MKVIERIIQEINPGKNTALEDIDKRFDVIEGPLGFPSKKRLWCFSGPHYTNTIVIEREWESMAVMEAAYEKFVAHPGIQTLLEEGQTIIKNSRIELYTPIVSE